MCAVGMWFVVEPRLTVRPRAEGVRSAVAFSRKASWLAGWLVAYRLPRRRIAAGRLVAGAGTGRIELLDMEKGQFGVRVVGGGSAVGGGGGFLIVLNAGLE